MTCLGITLGKDRIDSEMLAEPLWMVRSGWNLEAGRFFGISGVLLFCLYFANSLVAGVEMGNSHQDAVRTASPLQHVLVLVTSPTTRMPPASPKVEREEANGRRVRQVGERRTPGSGAPGGSRGLQHCTEAGPRHKGGGDTGPPLPVSQPGKFNRAARPHRHAAPVRVVL